MTGLYGIIQMLYWGIYAIVYGYVSVFLLGVGFSNTAEGMLVSLAALGAAFLQPMIASYADHKGGKALKQVLLVQVIVYLVSDALLFTLYISQGNITFMGILYAMEILLMQVLTPFVYSLGTLSIKEGADLDFGLARGLGSSGYSIASFLSGRAVAAFGIRFVPLVCLPLSVILLILLARFPYHGTKAVEKKTQQKESMLSFLHRYPQYTKVLIGALFLYSCHMLVNTFGWQILESKGGTSTQLGVGNAISSMTEIPVMILFGRYQSKVKPHLWLIVSGVFYVIRSLGYMFLPSVSAGFYLMQFLQIASWAVLCIVTVIYTTDVMKEKDEVRGQAYFTMMLSVATVLSSTIGGILLDHFGITVMLGFALVCSCIGTVIMISARKEK